MAESTLKVKKRRGPGKPWEKGQSGNPAGRPKGAAHKLGERFVQDLADEWHKRGKKALQDLENEPFVRVVQATAKPPLEIDVNLRISGWLDVLRDEREG